MKGPAMSEELYIDGSSARAGRHGNHRFLAAKDIEGVASVGASSSLPGFCSRFAPKGAQPAPCVVDVTMDDAQQINGRP